LDLAQGSLRVSQMLDRLTGDDRIEHAAGHGDVLNAGNKPRWLRDCGTVGPAPAQSQRGLGKVSRDELARAVFD
jgi:hypothetical protein